MGRGLIYQTIRNKKIVIFLAIIVMLFGAYSYYVIPKQEAPEISVPVATITTILPGASSEEVENLVTDKIENKLTEINGYENIFSFSRDNASVIIFWLKQEANIEKAWDELSAKMNEVQRELPKEAFEIEVNTRLADTAGALITLSNNDGDTNLLGVYANELRENLSHVDGISTIDILGVPEKQVNLEVDIEKLNSMGLNLSDIVKTFQAQNISIPAGSIESEGNNISVRNLPTFKTTEDIKNLFIAVPTSIGQLARIRDVANVNIENKELGYFIKQNGEASVLLAVYFQEEKNILFIGDEIKDILDTLKASLPQTITLENVLFQPEDVSLAITDFVKNLLYGLLFVILIVLVAVGIRNALIVSLAIPLSIFMTFIFMNLTGIKVHQISIAALIISLGLLVDNAIVISEAIQARLDAGQDRRESCVEGTKDVLAPVLTSTLTTIATFIPLLLLGGVAGEYISSIPQIVIVSLASSYLVAILVTPVLAYLFFKKADKKTSWLESIKSLFGKVTETAIKKKKTIILCTILIVGIVAHIALVVDLQFFPMADKDILYINVFTENKDDLTHTESISEKVRTILKNQEEIYSITEVVGRGVPKFYTTLESAIPSTDFAQFMMRVNLKETGRFATNTQFTEYLQEEIDASNIDARIFVKELEQGEPVGAPIQLRVIGKDLEKLKTITDDLVEKIKNVEGTANVSDSMQEPIKELLLDIKADRAIFNGLTKYEIQNEINIALQGREISTYNNEGIEKAVVLNTNIRTKEDMLGLGVRSPITGGMVSLREVSEIREDYKQSEIRRYNGERYITIYSDVLPGYNAVNVQRDIQNKLRDFDLEEGIRIVFDGEMEKIIKYFGDIGILAVLSLLLIFTILLFQFKSFRQVMIVLMTVPLSAVGSIIGLYIFKQPLSFTSLLGIVSLFGIIVNNAIVLLDFINNERLEGKSVNTACKDAVEKRFRPVILTTITTVIGLTPLAFSGSTLFVPMAIALISGLIISTGLTLVVIPVIYSIICKNQKIQSDKFLP